MMVNGFVGLASLFLILSQCVWAQSTTAIKVKNKIRELKKQGVDTLVTYYNSPGCNSLIPSNDTTCHWYDSNYLIWSRGGQSFIQRFDECKPYRVKKMYPQFMQLVIRKYKQLLTEKILPTEFPEYFWGIAYSSTSMYITGSGHANFVIYTPGGIVKKSVNDFKVSTEYSEGKRNVNFDRNYHTVSNQLKMLVEKTARTLY